MTQDIELERGGWVELSLVDWAPGLNLRVEEIGSGDGFTHASDVTLSAEEALALARELNDFAAFLTRKDLQEG